MKWILIAIGAIAVIVAAVSVVGARLPQNHTATRSSKFKKSQREVWEVIIGPPDWRPDIRSVEKLESHDGRRTWKEIDKHGQAITYESVEENPPHRLVTRIADPKLPFGGTWTQEISPDAEGCLVTITEAGEIYNPIFRFMSRFIFGYTGTIDAYLKALHEKLGG